MSRALVRRLVALEAKRGPSDAGSFIQRPGETWAALRERARAWVEMSPKTSFRETLLIGRRSSHYLFGGDRRMSLCVEKQNTESYVKTATNSINHKKLSLTKICFFIYRRIKRDPSIPTQSTHRKQLTELERFLLSCKSIRSVNFSILFNLYCNF